MREIQVPVLIVGGGGAGLSASIFLADLGIDSLLVERHPATSHLPKAHYLNQRTMEIFRQHGIAQDIYAKAAPRGNLGKMIWLTSLGGDGALDRKVIAEADALGGGSLAPIYDLKGVTPPTNIPQIRLEPILARLAAERNPERLLFRHEFVSMTETASGVEAIVRERDSEEKLLVRAQYVIGADGGKTIGAQLGVRMVGPTQMLDVVTLYVAADFSQYITEDRAVMRFYMNPDEIGTAQYLAGLLAFGPNHWDRHSEEWGVVFAYDVGDPKVKTDADAVALIKRFLKVNVPISVRQISHWTVEAVVADKMRVGRAFLVGDAAHKHPPAGGLGLNSAIQDAHNLCWKLAFVLRGLAPASLLNAYEAERRPVIERNAEWALFSWLSNTTLHAAMGFMNGAPEGYNKMVLGKLLADSADGESRRAYMNEVLKTARVEFAVHDLEMGFAYRRGALMDDHTPYPPRDPMGHVYTPSTHPGCRLPHAWLRCAETAISTHDLLPMGGFLVLTNAQGGDWCVAANRLAADTGLPIRAVRIGDVGCDASDPSGTWTAVSGIDSGGVVVARPDGHVCLRIATRVEDAYSVLRGALAEVLAAPTATPVSQDP